MTRQPRIVVSLALALTTALLASSAARAVTLCVGPCPPGDGVVGPIEVVTPPGLPLIDGVGITGIVLNGDAPPGPIIALGSILVHVPSGTLQAHAALRRNAIDVRSAVGGLGRRHEEQERPGACCC